MNREQRNDRDGVCETDSKAAVDSKTSYSAPELVEYGSLSALTNFGGSGSADFFGMQDGMGM